MIGALPWKDEVHALIRDGIQTFVSLIGEQTFEQYRTRKNF